MDKSTKELGKIIEKSQPENDTPWLGIAKTPPHQSLKSIAGVINDTELENTLKSTKNNTGFF